MISVKVAAEMIGTYQKHIVRLIARGKLPGAYRIGEGRNSPYIIPLQSVESYIAQQKAEQKKRGAATKATPR
jgi:hypothetical protein